MAYLTLRGASFDPAPLRSAYEVRPDGEVRIPLTRALLVGRAKHCDLLVDSGKIAREEALLEPTSEGWVVTNFGHNQGMWVNRERKLSHRLQPGDQFTLGPCLVVYVEEPGDAAKRAAMTRRLEIEQQLGASLDDETAWRVYADSLLEAQDPLGERIRGLLPDDRPWLGELNRFVDDGALELTWLHGMIRSARFTPHAEVWVEALTFLLASPTARLLERLEIPVLPLGLAFGGITQTFGRRLPDQLQRLVGEVLSKERRPALREVLFAPSVNPAFVPAKNVLELGDRAPWLVQGPRNGRIVPWREVVLEDPDGHTFPLVDAPPTGHPLAGARFECTLTWALVTAPPGLTLNGRDLPEGGAWLWDGDRLEGPANVSLRVRVVT
jgi:hypothetical protein